MQKPPQSQLSHKHDAHCESRAHLKNDGYAKNHAHRANHTHNAHLVRNAYNSRITRNTHRRHSGHRKHHHKRGEIYYCDLSKNNGNLQSGIRPVIILQNDIGNRYSPTTIVAPITSIVKKKYMPTHVKIAVRDIKDLRASMSDSVILLEQIFTINISELQNYVGWVDMDSPAAVKALEISLGLDSLQETNKAWNSKI